MDVNKIAAKIKTTAEKYKYAAIVLIVGLLLLLIPGKTQQIPETEDKPASETQTFNAQSLTNILQNIDGAGKVEVLLSVASGEQTLYQTDSDGSGEGAHKTNTVIVTDSQRGENGLVSQVNPPVYLGAIVVCQGADSPSVRLAISQAVTRITGLTSDCVCVLKMK